MFIEMLGRDPQVFFTVVAVVIFSVCVHEYCHALAALSQGDDTAAKAGHLTLNPMVHMGGTSLVLLALAGIAWGQTPVNPSRFRYSFSPALVSLAGPLSNLALMFLSVAFGLLVSPESFWRPILEVSARINAVLFLLNMLPFPPLDGFGVLETFIPPLRRLSGMMSSYGFFILLALFWFFNLGGWLFHQADQMTRATVMTLGRVL